jgi:hypothetical protein
MNFTDTYETSLLSYIQSRIDLLEKAVEEEVRTCDNIDITLLEQQFDRESDNFIASITTRVHQIRDEIKSHRPTNMHLPDYETRLIQYRQFIQSSSTSINRIVNLINSIFDQVTYIIKNILQWMATNVEEFIYILEQIHNAFKFISTFFKTH